MLRFYIEVARTAFRRQLIYRWANFAGLLTNVFFGIIASYVIIALYQARPVVRGYDVVDTLRYVWLVQAMIMVVLPFGWFDLMYTIRSGEVVSDLSKPYDFSLYWASRELGRSCYYVLFRAIPTYVIGTVLFRLGLPGNWQSWLAYVFALIFAALFGIIYRYLYNMVAFWIVEARMVGVFAATIAFFFTGQLIPLPFFPTWLHTLALWLPFNTLLNAPTEVFLSKVSGGMLWLDLARQLFWVLVFYVLMRWLTGIATRRVVVQGG